MPRPVQRGDRLGAPSGSVRSEGLKTYKSASAGRLSSAYSTRYPSRAKIAAKYAYNSDDGRRSALVEVANHPAAEAAVAAVLPDAEAAGEVFRRRSSCAYPRGPRASDGSAARRGRRPPPLRDRTRVMVDPSMNSPIVAFSLEGEGTGSIQSLRFIFAADQGDAAPRKQPIRNPSPADAGAEDRADQGQPFHQPDQRMGPERRRAAACNEAARSGK